jgi:hypothetical protein
MLLTLVFILVGGVSGSFFGEYFIVAGCLGGWFISVLEKGVEYTKSNLPTTAESDDEYDYLNAFSFNSPFIDSSIDESSLDDYSTFDGSMAIDDSTFSNTGLDDGFALNPVTALSMADGIGGFDVAGNIYGDDGSSFHHDDLFDDGFNSDLCFDSFDDNNSMCFNDDF